MNKCACFVEKTTNEKVRPAYCQSDFSCLNKKLFCLKSYRVLQQQLLGNTQPRPGYRFAAPIYLDAVDGVEVGGEHIHVVVVKEIDQ